MAKRFTDTTKWDNSWYRKMPWYYRDLWDYICDKCDHAGIWRVDLETASFIIGETVTERGAYEHFGDRVKFLKEDKWFIPGFVVFQYGKLDSEKKVCVSVRNILESYNIDPFELTLRQPLPNPYLRIKDKDKDKDKSKDKEKEKDNDPVFNLEALYQKYPLKKGKSEGIARLKKVIKTEDAYQAFSKAIDRYTQDIHARGTDPRYIKHFSSFVGTDRLQPWRDWLQDDAGTAIPVVVAPKAPNRAEMRSQANRAAAAAYMEELRKEEEV